MRNRRRRLAGRRPRTARDGIIAQIEDLERRIEAADDAQIDNWADNLADDERDTGQESTGVAVDDEGDQTEKGGDNWELTAGEKERVAKVLVRCAKMLSE